MHLSQAEHDFYTGFYGPRSLGAVDGASDTLALTERHVYGTGSEVFYHNGGATSLTNLVDGNPYYVIVVDDTHIKLATSAANAAAGIAIDLADMSGLGTTHSLSTDVVVTPQIAFRPESQVAIGEQA